MLRHQADRKISSSFELIFQEIAQYLERKKKLESANQKLPETTVSDDQKQLVDNSSHNLDENKNEDTSQGASPTADREVFADEPEFSINLAEWYQQLSRKQKRKLFLHVSLSEIIPLIVSRQDDNKVADQLFSDLKGEIASVKAKLLNYIASPDSDFKSSDFKILNQWYQANQKIIDDLSENTFNSALTTVMLIYTAMSKLTKITKIRVGKTDSADIVKISRWYSKNQTQVKKHVPDFLPLLVVTLTELSDKFKRANNNNDASVYAKNACVLADTLFAQDLLQLSCDSRVRLSGAYLYLAEILESSIGRLEESQRKSVREKAASYYLRALRCQREVEPFDQMLLINTFKELPGTGVCNGFTSRAILYYEKRQKEVSDNQQSYIAKMTAKMFGKEKPASLLCTLTMLQEHDVSANDQQRKPKLPNFTECMKILGSKHRSVEVLMDLGSPDLKHSMLIRVTRNRKNKPVQCHILDATFGEAHFDCDDDGENAFNHFMGILTHAYSLLYSDVRYVFVNKRDLLLNNNMLLFKSAPELEKPDMTFKEKISNKSKLV